MDFFNFLYLVLSFIIGCAIFWKYAMEEKYCETKPDQSYETRKDNNRHRTVLTSGSLFPCLILIWPLALILMGHTAGKEWILSRAFIICSSIILYDIIFLMLLPVIRRYFSADICASLWTLPDLLYLLFYSAYTAPVPKIILPFSARLMLILALIWLIGFCLTFLYRIAIHLRFRRQLLQDAEPVTEEWLLKLWSSIQEETLKPGKKEDDFVAIGSKKVPEIPLVRSSATRTPLTIGIRKKKIVVVLPIRDYSEEDLRLILLHEAGHIGGKDCDAKFFMTLCTCVFWFLPLHHIAMKMMAEDMEIACDEAVLQNESEENRYRYATLLLSRPGDSRGFSSCLSASGQSLKARMEKVIHPRKYNHFVGGLFLGLVTCIMIATSGFIRLSPEQGKAKDLIIGHEVTVEDLTGDNMNIWNRSYNKIDWEAFASYLNNLEVSRLYGEIRSRDEEASVYCRTTADSESDLEGRVYLVFYDDILRVSWYEHDEKKISNEISYHLRQITKYYYISDNSWRDILPLD